MRSWQIPDLVDRLDHVRALLLWRAFHLRLKQKIGGLNETWQKI